MNNVKKTQCDRILEYLLTGRGITQIEALNLFGCARLAARIHDLHRMNYDIKARMVTRKGKHFAEYYMTIAKADTGKPKGFLARIVERIKI